MVDQEAAYEGLRALMLRTDPKDIGFDAPGHTRVYGVLMETAYPKGTATLVSLLDGTTSLYLSTGGGVIGGGGHANIARASRDLIARAEEVLDLFEPTTEFPMPAIGRVRFHLLTFSGGFTVEADEEELGNGGSRLSRLFYAAHDVITQLRLLDVGQDQD